MDMDGFPPVALDVIWRFVPDPVSSGDDTAVAKHDLLLTLSEVCMKFALHFSDERLWKEAYFRRYQRYRKPGNLITTMAKLPLHERHSWRAAVREALILDEAPVRRAQFAKSDEPPARSSWEHMEKAAEPEDVIVLRQIVMEQRTKMRQLERDYVKVEDRIAVAKRHFEEVERRHSSARNCLLQSGYGDMLPHRTRCRRPSEPEKLVTAARPMDTDPRIRLSLEFVANETTLRKMADQVEEGEACIKEYAVLAAEERERHDRMRESVPAHGSLRRRPLSEVKTLEEKMAPRASKHKQQKQMAFNPDVRAQTTSVSGNSGAARQIRDASKGTPRRSVIPDQGKSLLHLASYVARERYNGMWANCDVSPTTTVVPLSTSRGASPVPLSKSNIPLLTLRQSTIMDSIKPSPGTTPRLSVPSSPYGTPRTSYRATQGANAASASCSSTPRSLQTRRSGRCLAERSASSLNCPTSRSTVPSKPRGGVATTPRGSYVMKSAPRDMRAKQSAYPAHKRSAACARRPESTTALAFQANPARQLYGRATHVKAARLPSEVYCAAVSSF